ncbi:hypothetical protein [Nocardioides potassii]|nr:hypothetical protein [Nocardioides potassii]
MSTTYGRHSRTDTTGATTFERLSSMVVALATMFAGGDGRHAR